MTIAVDHRMLQPVTYLRRSILHDHRSSLEQPAEKDPYASLRSIAALQPTASTPPLVDLSRASPLDLFEQPARGFFSATRWAF
jgi:hypothetical protein